MIQQFLFDEENKKVEFFCIEVTQPIGTFYVASMPCKVLCDITFSDVRRIEGEREFETYLGIQRNLDPKRVTKLKKYVNTLDASFPSGIIIAIDSRCVEYDSDKKIMTLYPYKSTEPNEHGDCEEIKLGQIAKVLDGQHRIEGLRDFGGKFELNVSIFIDADLAQQAYIFSTVNLAQTKVNKSLVYDLFDLANTRSPQKLCHNIAVTLNNLPKSPLYNRIKRLGSATPGKYTETITQANFVSALLPYITRDEISDRDIYMREKVPAKAEASELRNLIFRNMMIEQQDDELAVIIYNFFSAVSQRWPDAWNNFGTGNILNRTNGFRALMRFLRPVYLHLCRPGSVPSVSDFSNIFSNIKLSDFSTELYKPGTSGESRLYHDLLAGSGIENDQELLL